MTRASDVRKFEKYPVETWAIETDFAAELRKLGPDVTLSSGVVTARQGTTDATATVLASGTATKIGTRLQFTVKAGSDDVVYEIQLDATASDSSVLTEQFEMTILASRKP